mmetsp:Transcript_4560/g.16343  ORF Transcript_4560/g.16343 Transcript_4560/m.16343 type:complete len:239 (+) Transcript_4560:301-1017(+)
MIAGKATLRLANARTPAAAAQARLKAPTAACSSKPSLSHARRTVVKCSSLAERDNSPEGDFPRTGRLGQEEFDPGFVEPADIIASRSQVAEEMDVQSDAVPISFEVGLGDLGMQWLSSTTRHCHIFVGKMDDEGQWDQSQLDHLTIEVDPEDEFEWTDEALELVYRRFDELVEQYSGTVLDEYVLRLMGSEVEHFIRGQLLRGEIKYNVNVFNMNYSMGRPRLDGLNGPVSTELNIGA